MIYTIEVTDSPPLHSEIFTDLFDYIENQPLLIVSLSNGALSFGDVRDILLKFPYLPKSTTQTLWRIAIRMYNMPDNKSGQ